MSKKAVKITAITLASVIGLILLLGVAYVLYVVFQYDRIEDNAAVTVHGTIETSETVGIGREYSAVTYNIGFGAYSHDFSFFMDSGEMLDGTKVTGKYGKAISKEHVLKDMEGAIAELNALNSDFLMIQEVDTVADRSYKVNQYDMLRTELNGDYLSTFTVNYHSAYLMYPLNDHHGKSTAGLATFSKYAIDSCVRRSYPLDTGFAKFFDLDRCFAVHRIKTDNGKELVLVNSHMSAYDEGGTIRKQQLDMLNAFMKEENDKGNYVIVGGDFNHDLAESIGAFPTEQAYPDWAYPLTDDDLTQGMRIVASKENVGTCRAAEIPYTRGVNYTVVLDGFIVSDNVETASVTNIDTDFEWSDHNPVKFDFILK